MDDLFGSDSSDDDVKQGGGAPIAPKQGTALPPSPPPHDDKESSSSNIKTDNSSNSSNNNSSSASADSNCNDGLFEISSNIDSIGGGRGVFALKEIPAGTLILSEIPQMVWQNFDLSDADILRSIIQEILIDAKKHTLSKFLHPASIHEADSIEIANALDMYADGDFDAIVENFPKIQKDEILRIFLVLQHNAFASGLYKNLSLFNHSCIPNCIKFSPKPSNNGASEIWSIQPINVGEELTICYAESNLTTLKSMQEYLKLNHRFDCICGRCSALSLANINPDPLPNISATESSSSTSSSFFASADETIEVDEHLRTFECEHLVYEEMWKDELISMENEIKWQSIEENKSNFRTCRDIIKACKMRIESMGKIPKIDVAGHEKYCTCSLLENRTYKIIVNASAQCVEALQEIKSNPTEAVKYANKLASIDDFEYMGDFFVYNLKLAKGIISGFSSSHPDLAGVFLDIANGLESLSRAYMPRLIEMDLKADLGDSSDLLPVKACEGSVDETLLIDSKRKALDLISHFKGQGKVLRLLYNTRQRYPDVYRQVKLSGSYYWNGLKEAAAEDDADTDA